EDCLRHAGRQGRRWPTRHGAGRWPRRRQGRRGAVGDRKGHGRRLIRCAGASLWPRLWLVSAVLPDSRGQARGQPVATVPGEPARSDPNLRDRLYELLEHDHLPYSVGSRFVRLIVAIIILDVLAMIFASEPEIDARFGKLFTIIEIGAVLAFGLE